MVTLVEAPGATLWGMAYAIEARDWPEVLVALEHREKAGYRRLELIAGVAADERAGEVVNELPVEVFIGGSDRSEYVGPEELEVTAAIVRRSHGPSGSNRAYVLELDRALAAMGVHDPDVAGLADLVRDER